MKATFLLSTVCLAPLVLTAPLSRLPILIAGDSIWTPSAAQQAPVALPVDDARQSSHNKVPPHTATKWEESSSPQIDTADRPKTTHELMAASVAAAAAPHVKAKGGKAKNVVSVGTLVVPGGAAHGSLLRKLYDPESTPRYLIPGGAVAYVAKQRAEVLILGAILACVCLVIAVEVLELLIDSAANAFCGREGAIQLRDAKDGNGLEAWESDGSDDDCDAPFGGYSHRDEKKRWTLPDKVDEKAPCT